ncbi:glycosyl hydrolase 53 family protein [Actinoplanes sp. NPDC026619]|uniref:glycoside hydrolase family 53 protein n=1 Tax=Actinoplanes sp. NPDC026619 TaxID=3155798 RepID=UPI00340ED43D
MSSSLSRRSLLAGAGGLAVSALLPKQALAHAAKTTLSVRGADLSFLPQLEEAGVRYRDLAGRVRPAEQILANAGANYMRLRVWVDPPDGYSDQARALGLAKRAKRAGMKILLDPHYSDFWADPGKQPIPASWPTDLPGLIAKIRSYTRELVRDFARQGTPVDMIQIGNEITSGILWPAGQLYLPDGTQQWQAFTDLLKSGIKGAREGQCDAKIVLHIDRGGKMGDTQWFFDNITTYGVPFDIIGQSYYPMWHGSLAELQANLVDSVARYDKPVLLAEVSYPWTFEDGDGRGNIVGADTVLPDADRFPATPAGQAGFYEAVRDVLKQVPDGRGLGFLAWEPEWIPGVGWQPGAEASNDNLTQFDFTGRALPSIKAYRRL